MKKNADIKLLAIFTFKKVFPGTHDDSFTAFDAAKRWLAENGYSIGSLERYHPVGAAKGDVDISKWTNMGLQDKAQLDGMIVHDGSGFRGGTVTVHLAEDVAG